jgi:Flp pilus assembly pilin Flp
MKRQLAKLWTEDDGVLSFEWVLIVTLLAIGIVGGLAAARDAIVDELGDAAEAMLALDDSYTIDGPLTFTIDGMDFPGATRSSFTDAQVYTDCARTAAPDSDDDPGEFSDSDS